MYIMISFHYLPLCFVAFDNLPEAAAGGVDRSNKDTPADFTDILSCMYPFRSCSL